MERKEREFVCKGCGNVFKTTATHANYCKDCRKRRQSAYTQAYLYRKSIGENKIVGSEQICPKCGKKFIVKSGAQKMCAECRRKAEIKAIDEYKNNKFERVNVYVENGKKQELKDFASKHNLTLNQLFIAAVEQFIERTEQEEKGSADESD